MANKITVEDIVSRFNALDIKIRLGIFFGLIGLVGLIDYFAIMQFEIKALSSMDTSIKKQREDIEKLKADQARLGQMQVSLRDLKKDFERLQNKVRPLQELPLVLEDISKSATNAHLTVDQITPSREGQEDFVTVGGVKFFSIPVVIMLHGGYHNFGQFLNALDGSNLMYLVKDFKMESTDKQNSPIAFSTTFKVIVADKPMEAGK